MNQRCRKLSFIVSLIICSLALLQTGCFIGVDVFIWFEECPQQVIVGEPFTLTAIYTPVEGNNIQWVVSDQFRIENENFDSIELTAISPGTGEVQVILTSEVDDDEETCQIMVEE